MKARNIGLIVIGLLILLACNKKQDSEKFEVKHLHDNIYKINSNNSDACHDVYVSYYYNEDQVGHIDATDTVEMKEGSLELDILKVLKHFKNKEAIALRIARNEIVPLKIEIREYDFFFDTTIMVRPILKFKNEDTLYAKVTKGICARLEEKGNLTSYYTTSIRKYLYDRNCRISDSLLNVMVEITKELDRTNYKEYYPLDEIPVLSSYPDCYYSVQTNMKAENYYLIMAEDEEYLNRSIKEKVVNNFPRAEKTVSKPLDFWRYSERGGLQVLFLVGINNDWSKQVIPIGIIAIDNIYPTNNKQLYTESSEYNIELQSSKQRIIISQKPELNGFATLTELTSGGNGLSCQVSFSLTFGGDIKSVTLVREKYLTYPYPYDGYGYGYGVKPERRVIDLTNKTSPYKFSYTLHLGDGDNYLPVIVTDMRGNQIEYQINIPASFTRTPDTEININNNLNVN